MFETLPKMRYKIKSICGDYYYEMMSKEETMKKAFISPESEGKTLSCKDEIDAYVRDNLNEKLPLDGP